MIDVDTSSGAHVVRALPLGRPNPGDRGGAASRHGYLRAALRRQDPFPRHDHHRGGPTGAH